MMNKEEFLTMFRKCIEDGDIVIGLEKENDYDNYINIYPSINIYNSKIKESYNSEEMFRFVGISIKE